ncbi:hypothetical protein Vadar_016814 [Vaccinium darrowii]|uniref:Uncharacterized protein n=1 Tax=Vaccinium darrowii TaxID=229202 RepID=A0ACB7XRW6_9ERIC|nr:hypothetical protein Vadar_016814 [Vaccinium darrowii]
MEEDGKCSVFLKLHLLLSDIRRRRFSVVWQTEGAWNSLKESPNFEPELVSSRVKHATKALTTYMAAIKTWLRPELDFSEVDEEE